MIAVELDRVDPTIGQRIRNDIAAELNLRVSAAIATVKFVAKIDLAKKAQPSLLPLRYRQCPGELSKQCL